MREHALNHWEPCVVLSLLIDCSVLELRLFSHEVDGLALVLAHLNGQYGAKNLRKRALFTLTLLGFLHNFLLLLFIVFVFLIIILVKVIVIIVLSFVPLIGKHLGVESLIARYGLT